MKEKYINLNNLIDLKKINLKKIITNFEEIQNKKREKEQLNIINNEKHKIVIELFFQNKNNNKRRLLNKLKFSTTTDNEKKYNGIYNIKNSNKLILDLEKLDMNEIYINLVPQEEDKISKNIRNAKKIYIEVNIESNGFSKKLNKPNETWERKTNICNFVISQPFKLIGKQEINLFYYQTKKA